MRPGTRKKGRHRAAVFFTAARPTGKAIATIAFPFVLVAAGDAAALEDIACTTDEQEICEAGDGDCLRGASVTLDKCKDVPVVEKCVSMIASMCNANNAAACAAYGLSKAKGTMGRVDEEGALALYDKACEMGWPKACKAAADTWATSSLWSRWRRSC